MTWQREKPVRPRGYRKGGLVSSEEPQHKMISTSPQTSNLVFKKPVLIHSAAAPRKTKRKLKK